MEIKHVGDYTSKTPIWMYCGDKKYQYSEIQAFKNSIMARMKEMGLPYGAGIVILKSVIDDLKENMECREIIEDEASESY